MSEGLDMQEVHKLRVTAHDNVHTCTFYQEASGLLRHVDSGVHPLHVSRCYSLHNAAFT